MGGAECHGGWDCCCGVVVLWVRPGIEERNRSKMARARGVIFDFDLTNVRTFERLPEKKAGHSRSKLNGDELNERVDGECQLLARST